MRRLIFLAVLCVTLGVTGLDVEARRHKTSDKEGRASGGRVGRKDGDRKSWRRGSRKGDRVKKDRAVSGRVRDAWGGLRPGDLYSYSGRFAAWPRRRFDRSRATRFPTGSISSGGWRAPIFLSGAYPYSGVGGTVRLRAPLGAIVAVLPTGVQRRVIRTVPYYYAGPDCYIDDPAGYGYRVVERPDERILDEYRLDEHTLDEHRLAVLPSGFEIVVSGADPVYGVEGRFYQFDKRIGRYVEVAAEPGWSIQMLPSGFETLHYKGEELYRVEETYFRYDDERAHYIVTQAPT